MSKELSPEIIDLVQKLEKKYKSKNQDLAAYLEGRLYEDYIPYWDYIHLDTLMTLQKPRTRIPDEMIFVVYHQVTELYFKMILHELEQVAEREKLTGDYLKEKLKRVRRYFEILTASFDVMGYGMEPEQFLKFRMSLMPASGFQSAQYRMVEIASTSFLNLVDKNQRHRFTEESDITDMYKHIYWQEGGTNADTGEKTFTLTQFEEKYNEELLEMAHEYRTKNIWARYTSLPNDQKTDPELIKLLKALDSYVNVNWPLAHYKTAAQYLQKGPEDVAATGGTNWQKYLPPRFQRRIFYPKLWTETEITEWGKSWVTEQLSQ